MSLRIIYGRAGSGKSTFCLNEIKESLAVGTASRHIIIVPEQFSFQAEKRLIAALGASGINGVEVLSFGRLSYRVLGEVGGIVRKHINPSGKSILVYTILEKHRENLKVFAKAAGQRGFVNTLCGTISELKRYNITTDVLSSLDTAGMDSRLADKLHDIGLIYEEFEKRLHERYIDSDDDLTLLAERLAKYDLPGDSEIWLDEFSGFTPQEYTIIEKLLTKASRVNVALCTDCLADEMMIEEIDAFLPVKTAAARLRRLAAETGAGEEAPVAVKNSGFKYNDELAFLEAHLHSFLYGTYKGGTEHLRLYEASGIYSEVENTAGDILRKCRDEGLRYSDIAVITGDLALYEKVIKAVFGEYGIPCFIDRKKSILGHPIVLLVLSALEVFIGNWSYESVFRYLKTGLTGISRKDIDFLENYVLATGKKGSSWIKADEWEGVNDSRRAAAAPLLGLHGRIKGKSTCFEMCTTLYEFLCEIGVPERLEELVRNFTEAGELDRAGEYSQVWNILMELLDQVVEAMGEERVNIEAFHGILSVGFGEYSIGLIPKAIEQVTVGSLERSRSHDIKALYILGANDGIFPVPFRHEGILSDGDREALGALGVELAPDTRGRTFEQQHLIYTALTAPSEYMRLSWRASDSDGKALRPSAVINRLRRMFPGIRFESGIADSEPSNNGYAGISAPVPAFNGLTAAMRQKYEGRLIDPVWEAAAQWYKEKEGWREKYARMMEGFGYTNQVKPINRERIRKLYSDINTNISRLERYFSCPFSYYLEYGIKARERRIMKMNAPDMGSFMHNVIDRFSNIVSESGIGWGNIKRDWCAEKVALIVDELMTDAFGGMFMSSARYKYFADRLKKVLTRSVWLISEHMRRSSFAPVGYELGFGVGGKLPAITLELPSGEKMALSGRIDRLDCLEREEGRYFRIVDYKSGSKSLRIADIYYGLQLQLITYLDAAGESLKDETGKPVIPAGMLYFTLNDPIVRGSREASEEEIERAIMKELKMKGLLLADVKLIKEMDTDIDGDSLIIPARVNKGGDLGRSSAATAEQFDMLKRHTRELMKNLGQEMLKGNIAISPYRKKSVSACTYCRYKCVCQFDMKLAGNKYRNLQDMKEEEIWRLIGEKTEEGGDTNGISK